MKCPDCNGTGKSKYGYNQPCTHCYGKGFVEPLTNEEYMRSCTTEQLAKFLHDVQFSCNTCTPTSFRLYKSKIMKCPLNVACAKENGIEEWLKQPHTPIS